MDISSGKQRFFIGHTDKVKQVCETGVHLTKIDILGHMYIVDLRTVLQTLLV